MLKELHVTASMLYADEDRIIAYLKGQMPEEEGQKFLKELKEDADLREKAVIIARLVKGLKQVGRKKDRDIMDALLASDEQEVERTVMEALGLCVQLEYFDYSLKTEEPPAAEHAMEEETVAANAAPKWEAANAAPKWNAVTPKRRKPIGRWLAVAASVALIVWLGVEYHMYRTTTGLGQQYGNAFTSGVIARGTGAQTQASRKLAKLFADVKEGKNIGEAIHELAICWELSTMDTYNDYTDYSAEIGWNLAIAHLKDNDRSGARKVLERLVKTSVDGSAINRKAKELLSKM